jgi:hypothetical protein
MTTWLDFAWLRRNGLRVCGIPVSLNAQRGRGQKSRALAWADLKMAELDMCLRMRARLVRQSFYAAALPQNSEREPGLAEQRFVGARTPICRI